MTFSIKDVCPSDWEVKKVGDVARLNLRSIKKSFAPSVIRYVDISSVGTRERSKPNEILYKDAPSRAQRIVSKGDTLISMVRPNLKSFVYIDKEEENLVASTGFACISPIDIKDSRYIHYFLTSDQLVEYYVRYADGAAYPAFDSKLLPEIEIPWPNDLERFAIGELLGSLDDRISLLRETNSTLEAIAQAIFKSWFVSFDPVRAKMEGRPPEGIDETTAALFPDSFEETELGSVPRGWRVDVLEKWLSVLETGRRPKGGVSGIEFGVPSVGAESITRIGEFDYGKTKFVSPEFFEKMKSGVVESHDVLLYKDGGKPGEFMPRVSMFGDGFPFQTFGINEHVFRIRLKEPFGQTFLYFWLWSDAVMHELKHRGGKAAIPGINQSDVKEQKLAVPCDLILKRFEELTSPLISQIFNNSNKMHTLAALRDSLLPRLISGQLRVPEAEEHIETAIQ